MISHFKKILTIITNKIRGISENNLIVVKNVLGTFVVKGLSLFISLFSMPVYIRYFNNETVLGLWFTIISVLSWILNFDLGIGNGLRNHLTTAISKYDRDDIKKYISSAYVSVGIVCSFVIIAFFTFYRFVDWNSIFNIKSSIVSPQYMLIAVGLVFIGIILQLFFKLINSILYALQKAYINNFLNLITTLIALVAVLILPSGSNEHNIVVISIVHLFSTIMPLLVTTFIVFKGSTLSGCFPSVRFFSFKHAKQVLSLGTIFLILQIAQLVIMATNEYLISIFSGNEAVVEYQIYHKLAILGSTVFSLALIPVWSTVTKAISENKYSWVASLYKRFLFLGSIGVVFQILMIPFYQPIINVWLGSATINVNYFYAFSFALLGSVIIYNSIFFYITNGIGKLKLQTFMYILGALIKIPLAWLLVEYIGSWIGVVLANIVSLVMYCIVQPIWLKQFFSKMQNSD